MTYKNQCSCKLIPEKRDNKGMGIKLNGKNNLNKNKEEDQTLRLNLFSEDVIQK